jgi:hypothetical protein
VDRTGGEEEEDLPFLIAFDLSALRCACAGLMDFSFGILRVVVVVENPGIDVEVGGKL